MKKLLICDFDDTIFLSHVIKGVDKTTFEQETLFAINNFRKANNLIFINTGRSFNSFKKNNIFDYDYLCCNNGAELYDCNDKLIELHTLDQNDLKTINNYEINSNCIVKYYRAKDTAADNITAISITCNDEKEFNKMIKFFKNNLININCFYSFPKIRLVNKLIDKITTINKVLKLEQLDKSNVFAIGDGDNDYLLLKTYCSAKIEWCTPLINSLQILTVNNISQFINVLENYDK